MSTVSTETQQQLPENYTPGSTLPRPLKGDFRQLSESAKSELRALFGPRPGYFYKELILAWVTIIATMALALYIDSLWFSLVAIIIIATRQNILGLLIHEQVHYLCQRTSTADAMANLLAGWPLLILSVENYAKIHLSHHRYYFSGKDPDFFRKNTPEWVFPMPWKKLAWLFFNDLIGFNLIKNIKGKNTDNHTAAKRAAPLSGTVKIVYFLLLACAFTYWQIWDIVIIYWLIPLLTVLQVIVRFGAICEHKYNAHTRKLEDSTAIITLRWWEKLILPNLNFSYHIYHHYFPGISFHNLPGVHAIFEREQLVSQDAVFTGYFSYIKHLMTADEHPSEVFLQPLPAEKEVSVP